MIFVSIKWKCSSIFRKLVCFFLLHDETVATVESTQLNNENKQICVESRDEEFMKNWTIIYLCSLHVEIKVDVLLIACIESTFTVVG